MARHNRTPSKTGCYHVMLRGNDKMDIFLDDQDRATFLKILDKKNKEVGCDIFAYCLMDNHIHLVIRENMQEESLKPISLLMKKIGISYVYYFNAKYERLGTLFQDRFKSEIIENDRYVLAAVRYTLQNPWKAGIVKKIEDYKWSSVNEYLNGKSIITDINFVYSYFGSENDKNIFQKFLYENGKEKFIDIKSNRLDHIKYVNKVWNCLKDKDLSVEDSVKKLRKITSISTRMISKVTGIHRLKVIKILREKVD